ncbi:MAG: ATP-binding protein [Candidatus Peribacteraceae bacterium]|nr:ATP-binding protein [Candidatus Peribacteraceae bacterium]
MRDLNYYTGETKPKLPRPPIEDRIFSDLSLFGDTVVGQILSPKETETIPYGCIPLGWTVYNKKLHRKDFRSRPLFLRYDVKSYGTERNILIYGAGGSGKTFLVRSMMDRHKAAGFNVCILTDVKNEYKTSLKMGESSRIMSDFGERSQSQDMTIYRPMFFGNPFELGEHNQIMQFSISDLSRLDWEQLLQLDLSDPRDANKRPPFEVLWNFVTDEENPDINMDSLMIHMTNSSEVDERNRKTFLNRLKLLKDSDTIGTMHNVKDSLRLDLEERKTIVINLEGYENYKLYSQIYVAIINRILVSFQKDIHIPLEFVVDEANAFIPQDGNTSTKEEIMLNINRRRYSGIKMTTATQRVKDIAENVVSQAQVIFIPSNPDMEELINLIKKCGLYRQYGGSATRYTVEWWRTFMDSVKKHQWILYDKKEDVFEVFDPCHPLSHQQSSQ